MEDKKITITRTEIIETSASILAEDEKMQELIKDMPLLLLLFAAHTAKVWAKLKEIHENDQVETN